MFEPHRKHFSLSKHCAPKGALVDRSAAYAINISLLRSENPRYLLNERC